MNAMFDRLRDSKRGFGSSAVGLQHGRSLQALYARLIDQEDMIAEKQNAARQAAWERNLNVLHARPVKVFSPYQMIKIAFQIKGFEGLLTDYTDAAFIFDEIHAYEPKRLALFLALIDYLHVFFGARFFVMSATFPRLIREKLQPILGYDQPIVADEAVFQRFRRHQLHLLDGEMLDSGITHIVSALQQGKQVLACVNTVRRAQELYHALIQTGVTSQQVILIHSRLIIKHRTEREAEIMQRCDLETGSREPFVLVATQVVEVSLNIDLDVMYTDPAPLEALLQRFGRVNRACKKGISPVYVFRQPNDGQYVYGAHPDPAQRGHIVRVTLAELAQHDGEVIDESAINSWLDRIYDDPQVQTEWQQTYDQAFEQAQKQMRQVRPFQSDRQTNKQFEDLFDGIDVLPERYYDAYLRLTADHDYIAASSYVVNINRRKFARLQANGLIQPVDEWTAMVKLPYSETTGLAFDEARAIDYD